MWGKKTGVWGLCDSKTVFRYQILGIDTTVFCVIWLKLKSLVLVGNLVVIAYLVIYSNFIHNVLEGKLSDEYFLISWRATVLPGQNLWGFFTPPITGFFIPFNLALKKIRVSVVQLCKKLNLPVPVWQQPWQVFLPIAYMMPFL